MNDSKKNSQLINPKNTLVFLHYFGGSAASWGWVIEKLPKEYRCIAVTLPGFGSTPSLENISIKNFADFAKKEMDSKNIFKYTLIGHSMGGKIALQIAADSPENIHQIILIAPSPPTTENISEKDKERMLKHQQSGVAEKIIKGSVKKPLSEQQLKLAIETQLNTDPETWRWWIERGTQHSIADQLLNLNLAITILSSKDDPNITPEVIKNQVLPYLKNAKSVTTKGIGHLSPFEAPDWIADQIVIAIN